LQACLHAPRAFFSDISISFTLDGVEIAGSPVTLPVWHFPDAASSHNIVEDTELVSSKEFLLELRASSTDKYDNALTTASGYSVTVGDDAPQELSPPEFKANHTILAGYEGEMRARLSSGSLSTAYTSRTRS